MGLSSSKSTTKSTENRNTTEQTSGTSMPVAPDWLTSVAQDYVGRIGAFGDMDPNSFVAGASPLQQQAWQNVGALSGWQGQAATASQIAQAAGKAPPNTVSGPALAVSSNVAAPKLGNAAQATATGYKAPTIDKATGYKAPTLAKAQTVGAQGYAAPKLGAAPLVTGQGYTAPNLANAQTYAAARAGAPIQAASQGYAANLAQAATIDPAAQAQAAQLGPAAQAQAASLLDNFEAYRNPYTNQVIDATLAEYDQSIAQQQARLAAQGAKSGAFGGSRFGKGQGHDFGSASRRGL
jgi:hypothetical protein